MEIKNRKAKLMLGINNNRNIQRNNNKKNNNNYPGLIKIDNNIIKNMYNYSNSKSTPNIFNNNRNFIQNINKKIIIDKKNLSNKVNIKNIEPLNLNNNNFNINYYLKNSFNNNFNVNNIKRYYINSIINSQSQKNLSNLKKNKIIEESAYNQNNKQNTNPQKFSTHKTFFSDKESLDIIKLIQKIKILIC